jgi:glycine oxidase
VTIRGDNVESVMTSAGEISPGAVVFATGQPPVLDGLPLDIPSDRVKGHLIVTAPTKVHLPCTVAPVATPLEDGRLLAGGTFDYGDESPVVRVEVVDTIMGGLRAALPGVKDVGVSHQWCCFRPRHPDRRPVIDRVPGLRNAWLTSGHFRTGILNAPATGMAISRWIDADKPPPEARAWSAGRFAARGTQS